MKLITSNNKLLTVLTVFLWIWVVLVGFSLDTNTELTQGQLIYAFYTSGVFGLLPVALLFIFRNNSLWKKILIILLALLVWRIAYFPVMVLAGYLATLGESVSIMLLGKSVVYPFLLLSVALMNAFSLLIAGMLLQLLFILFTPKDVKQQNNDNTHIKVWSSLSLISLTLPLAVLAIGVSFTQPADWHAIPDTSYIDDKPLPKANLPEINPYSTALEQKGLSWQHKVLFKAAEVTYDLIPENTQWSQVVKGTLESEFVNTKEVSTAFCTKVHLRAFMTAQPFLNGKESISNIY